MMNNNSTTAMILKTLLRLAKDVDMIKKEIFNGLGQKVDVLWAWKEEHPTRRNFLAWLEKHPEMNAKVKRLNKANPRGKKK